MTPENRPTPSIFEIERRNNEHSFELNHLRKKMVEYDLAIDKLNTRLYEMEIEHKQSLALLDATNSSLQRQNQVLHDELNMMKALLTENGIIDKPRPVYNYTEIASRIETFKYELLIATKWFNKRVIPMAVPVKSV